MFQADLELFRSVREETLRLPEGLSQEQIDFAPGPGRWSVGEVLDHLLLSEKLYREKFDRLIELEKSGQKPVLHSSFTEINTSIGFFPRSLLPWIEMPLTVFNFFVPTFIRETMTQYRLLPAQNPDIATPRKGRPLGELLAELRSSFRLTAALFVGNPGLDYKRMRFSHPLMGDNNALQVLRILALHERRHQGQIRDVMRSVRFPQPAAA